MMSIKIKILEQLLKKINYGMDNNNILKSIKNIYIGSFSETRTNDNLPFINIFIKNIKEEPVYLKGRGTINLDILIRLVCSKLKQNNNVFYKKDGDNYSGPLIIFNELLNVLDKNSEGQIDLSWENTVFNNPEYDCEVIEDNDLIIFNINFLINSSEFSLGNR